MRPARTRRNCSWRQVARAAQSSQEQAGEHVRDDVSERTRSDAAGVFAQPAQQDTDGELANDQGKQRWADRDEREVGHEEGTL